MLLAGCGEKKRAKVRIPAPPPISTPEPQLEPQAEPRPSPSDTVIGDGTPSGTIPPDWKPIYVETGIASWYGPPYHNRRGSNGEVFDTNRMTAAHRTLPLNSVVRVTNLTTHRSALVRITDRGPFIAGRVLDLSAAAAKKLDVWRPGLAEVKIEVLRTPVPIDEGGRWCVQIGAFGDVKNARDLKQKLARKYPASRVLEFAGPTGEWLRVRVAEDNKQMAQQLAHATDTPEGAVFLVRLD